MGERYSRLMLDLDSSYPSAFSCRYFGYLLFCLGWIVAFWDITLNSCLLSSILICSVSIVIAKCPRNPSNIYTWCCFSHLMRRFTDDSWCEASFENLTICFLLCSVPCFFLLCFGYSLSLDRVQCMDGERGNLVWIANFGKDTSSQRMTWMCSWGTHLKAGKEGIY